MKDNSKGKRANQVVRISNDLVSQISDGQYEIGAKLPSESKLAAQYGVSRAVVREAIAALRLSGVVKTHQGAGAFVEQLPGFKSSNGFRPVDLKKISSVIEALEMRIAIESEAAALAAERRSPVQAAQILEALEAFGQDVQSGQSPSGSDLQFHMAIAEATNNSRFSEFLTLMEAAISPRAQLDGPMADSLNSREYFENLYLEHKKIADAIYKRDSEASRKAMNTHIQGTLDRYAGMLPAINL